MGGLFVLFKLKMLGVHMFKERFEDSGILNLSLLLLIISLPVYRLYILNLDIITSELKISSGY